MTFNFTERLSQLTVIKSVRPVWPAILGWAHRVCGVGGGWLWSLSCRKWGRRPTPPASPHLAASRGRPGRGVGAGWRGSSLSRCPASSPDPGRRHSRRLQRWWYRSHPGNEHRHLEPNHTLNLFSYICYISVRISVTYICPYICYGYLYVYLLYMINPVIINSNSKLFIITEEIIRNNLVITNNNRFIRLTVTHQHHFFLLTRQVPQLSTSHYIVTGWHFWFRGFLSQNKIIFVA